MSAIAASRDSQPSRPLTIARLLLTLSAVSLLAIWLINLPEYFERVTTLSVDTYTLAGEAVTSNYLVQTEAAVRGLSLSSYARYQTGISAISLLAFWLVAALVLWRAENRWFGWLTASLLTALGALNTSAVLKVTQPGQPAMLMVNLLSWIVWPVMFGWFYLFPGNSAVPRWAWRLVLLMQALSLGLSVRGFLASWGVLAPDPAQLQSAVGQPVGLVTLALVLYAQGYRYRYIYSPQERQQVKWFVFGMVLLLIEVVTAIGIPSAVTGGFGEDLGSTGLLVIPASIGIAILRYRLWDIDVIIRKTLVYGALTALLALVYFGGVVSLQRLFGALTGVAQSPLAVAVSTLAIVALFTPLRRRIQDTIDRRFYRRKYDAQQVLAQFAQTARNETDLDALTGELARVVQDTLQPEGVSVWLSDHTIQPSAGAPAPAGIYRKTGA